MPKPDPQDHTTSPRAPLSLRDILVPKSLLRAPDRFGGSLAGDCLRGDLLIENARAVRLVTAPESETPRMLIPAPVEAHCHLDKCHSVARMGAVGGDLASALAAQRQDKARWTAQDLRHRMARGLDELDAAGCMSLRSHIDWGDGAAAPLAWAILRELAQDRPDMTVQAAALTGIDQLADRDLCGQIARAVAATPGGVLGTFVLHHDPDDIRKGIENAFAAADRFGIALDFHVDEGLGQWNGLEVICDAALACGFDGPVLCGHAVSLIDRTGDDLERLLDKLRRARIAVCALPTTNLYLQGRRSGTPDRRGLTRLLELRAAGVPIAVASDNVGDAFCPTGQHDPRAALHLASLAAHLDPPMGDWLPAITIDPARAMGMDTPYIEDLPPAALRLCGVATTADLVAGRAPLTPLATHYKDPTS